MDKINHMVKRLFLLLFLVFASHTSYSQDFISIEHIGEEDSPIGGVLIVKSDSVFIRKSGEFTKFGVNKIDYEILKWYSLNKKIKKNHSCGSIKKTHGAFEIRIYEEGKLDCFILKNPSRANGFIKGMIIESIEYGITIELINDLRRIRNILDSLDY